MLRHFTDCSTHLQFADHAEAGISSGIPTLPLLARQVRAFFRLYAHAMALADFHLIRMCRRVSIQDQGSRMHANAR